MELDIRSSALKHGITSESIAHAVTLPLLVDNEFSDWDPPKVLVLGPDAAGNVLEVMGMFFDDERSRSSTRCPLERGYLRMLDRKENQ